MLLFDVREVNVPASRVHKRSGELLAELPVVKELLRETSGQLHGGTLPASNDVIQEPIVTKVLRQERRHLIILRTQQGSTMGWMYAVLQKKLDGMV